GELDVRPIRHRLADRVRAHMFLRMLSYYISWHMKAALAPILFVDNEKPAAAAKRTNPVAPAQRSDEALTKAARKRTDDHTPVHSFTSLLADLATICANQSNPPTTCRHSPRSPPPPHYSGAPSNYSPSPTASATRSQYPHRERRQNRSSIPQPVNTTRGTSD